MLREENSGAPHVFGMDDAESNEISFFLKSINRPDNRQIKSAKQVHSCLSFAVQSFCRATQWIKRARWSPEERTLSLDLVVRYLHLNMVYAWR